MTDLANCSALEIGSAIRGEVLSPVECVEYFINAIKKNRNLNAVVQMHASEALEKARSLENRIHNGEDFDSCPFLGVPFLLKDFLDSKPGWTHTYGGVLSMEREDRAYSPFCEAMEKLGGIALGKTNSPSFGFSALCYNKAFGATKNPHNPELNSGGSSGGSAAAVAAGLIPIAEGGDAGGSIRVPAAWCGIFGMKPSAGMISNYCRPNAWAATHPYCTNFGLTKCVADARILFDAMRQYDRYDPTSVPEIVGFTPMHMGGKRIGYTTDYGIFKVESGVSEEFEKILKFLDSLGYQLEEIECPEMSELGLEEMLECWCLGLSIDTSLQLRNEPNWKESDLPEDFVRWYHRALEYDINDYERIQRVRTRLFDMQCRLFGKYDFVVSPVTCCPPISNSVFDSGKDFPNIQFAMTFMWNFTGNPAAAVPVMSPADGKIPPSIQVVAPRFKDKKIFNMASYLEGV